MFCIIMKKWDLGFTRVFLYVCPPFFFFLDAEDDKHRNYSLKRDFCSFFKMMTCYSVPLTPRFKGFFSNMFDILF